MGIVQYEYETFYDRLFGARPLLSWLGENMGYQKVMSVVIRWLLPFNTSISTRWIF